uniref:Uncharacterized protein n=1 Tax=Ornithorhynchus anatinus TaxID=9258 RepID=A0A6I8N677_ORNAN
MLAVSYGCRAGELGPLGARELARHLVRSNLRLAPAELASWGHRPVCQALLEHGARADAADGDGRVPALLAAQEGHCSCLGLLLEHAADADRPGADGRNALRASAAWQGHAAVVELLLDLGAAVDHACNQGATALGIAAQEGHADVVRALLERGADPNHADQYHGRYNDCSRARAPEPGGPGFSSQLHLSTSG